MEQETKKQLLLRAKEIVEQLDEHEIDLATVVAMAMQTGYELGKLEAKSA